MYLPKIRHKKAALEMSIGTIVIIVIGMAMLILGLVLVRTIFTGATDNITTVNDKVRERIGKLFEEDDNAKSTVLLAEGRAEISQGEQWGLAFSVKNIETGTAAASTFAYNVIVSTSYTEADCPGLSPESALSWVKTRRSGQAQIIPGENEVWLITLDVPTSAPLCIVPYDITVTKDGAAYDSNFFDIVVK